VELERKIDCIINLQYSGRTLPRRELVVGARTCVRIYRGESPYPERDDLGRKKITAPSSPGVGTARHHLQPAWLCPNTKDH